ncbi:hypothetical protein G6F40_014686 [Rhizopus arrhizus]|nr:hypothetical protein G6F40_014686 [Rhizopus arrhizus]
MWKACAPFSTATRCWTPTIRSRTPLIQRFAAQSFGTVNFSTPGSYCGQSFRVGAGAALGDLKGMPHGKPDWDNARFGPAIGRSTGAAGGRQLHLCGRVAHAARVLQPVGRLRQRVGAGESCQRPGIGDGPDPLDPGQRTLRCPHVGATRPQRHEGGGRSRLDQRHASGGG